MHPKNGLKLTGNTRLPETMDDLYDDDEAATLVAQETRVYADGFTPPAPAETLAALREEPDVPEPTRMQRFERKAGHVGERAPWILMAGGFLLGCIAARLLRRD
jgi:hypothetical protein